jgi:hypothetical protein
MADQYLQGTAHSLIEGQLVYSVVNLHNKEQVVLGFPNVG